MARSRQKLTEWFDKYTKPVRCGVYQRGGKYNFYFSYWDGQHWFRITSSKERAVLLFEEGKRSALELKWRGLKKI